MDYTGRVGLDVCNFKIRIGGFTLHGIFFASLDCTLSTLKPHMIDFKLNHTMEMLTTSTSSFSNPYSVLSPGLANGNILVMLPDFLCTYNDASSIYVHVYRILSHFKNGVYITLQFFLCVTKASS